MYIDVITTGKKSLASQKVMQFASLQKIDTLRRSILYRGIKKMSQQRYKPPALRRKEKEEGIAGDVDSAQRKLADLVIKTDTSPNHAKHFDTRSKDKFKDFRGRKTGAGFWSTPQPRKETGEELAKRITVFNTVEEG